MNHFKHFVVWLLAKWCRTVFAWPIQFNKFYRNRLRYEPVLFSIITGIVVFLVLIATGIAGASIENGHVYIKGMDLILNIELFGIIGYYVYTMLSIQYINYCDELKDTVARLKQKNEPW